MGVRINLECKNLDGSNLDGAYLEHKNLDGTNLEYKIFKSVNIWTVQIWTVKIWTIRSFFYLCVPYLYFQFRFSLCQIVFRVITQWIYKKLLDPKKIRTLFDIRIQFKILTLRNIHIGN